MNNQNFDNMEEEGKVENKQIDNVNSGEGNLSTEIEDASSDAKDSHEIELITDNNQFDEESSDSDWIEDDENEMINEEKSSDDYDETDDDLDSEDHFAFFAAMHLHLIHHLMQSDNEDESDDEYDEYTHDDFKSPWGEAVIFNDFIKIEKLLNEGFNVNKKLGHKKNTALHLAAICNNPRIVDVLLKYKANVNTKNANESTPLHLASFKGNLDVVKKLITAGADLNKQDHKGHTPVMVVSLPAILEAILIHQPDLSLKSKTNKTALEIFAQKSKDLKECYINCVNEVDELNKTKIHGQISLRMVIFMNPKRAAKYCTNQVISNILDADLTFTKKFPAYGYLLDDVYQKAKLRKQLQVEAHNALQFFTHINIPEICTEELFNYFDLLDLRRLKNSKKEFNKLRY